MKLFINSFPRYLSSFAVVCIGHHNVKYIKAEEEVSPHSINSIVNGTAANYDYVVSLTSDYQGYGHVCGGSLIAPGYVLSAAHCKGIPYVKALIGGKDFSNSSQYYETIQVEYEVIHPDYDCETRENDIMVMKLAENSSFKPIPFDTQDIDLFSGQTLNVMGYGFTSTNGVPSGFLLETTVDVVSNSDCADIYREFGHEIFDSMICADSDNDSGFCYGDSGGPLIIKGNSTSDLQVGIVSHGYSECAHPKYGGIYTRVGRNAGFINCVITGGSDECGEVCYEKSLTNIFLKAVGYV